jgi:hypothetical protein
MVDEGMRRATDVVTEDIKRLANNTLVGVRFIIQMDER